MPKLAKLKFPAILCAALGILFTIAGFFGQKMSVDGAKLPQTPWLTLMTEYGLPILCLGVLLIVASLFVGNVATHQGCRASDFFPYLLIIPAFIFLLVFVIYPMFSLLYLSLFQGNLMKPTKAFMGLKNYHAILFVKTDFLVALRNTAVYTLSVVVLLIVFAILFSLWMFKDRKINRFMQISIFTPHLIASVCSGFIWAWLMNQNSYGLLNTVLGFFGQAPVRWLESSDTAMMSIVIVTVWKSAGYYALIVLAAMKSIPTEIYEAAELDNTSSMKRFFKITLPLLSPQLFFLLITITIGSFKVFDTINVMTEGGPGNSTEVLARYIYDYA
ncbi:MAG: sugar ABC transporter permease, partial [Clostridia bacterium]